MKNKETLKKKIIFRATHRGSKEMDLLLGKFVKKYINQLEDEDLQNLTQMLSVEDEILYSWYFNNNSNEIIKKNNVTIMFKNFKI